MKSFFQTVGLVILSFFAAIGVGASIMFLLFAVLISQVSSSNLQKVEAPPVSLEKSYLHLELSGPLLSVAPRPSEALFAELLGEPTGTSLRDVKIALRRAADDIRVHGVYIDIKSPAASLTTIVSLRRSLTALTASGKPVWINLSAANTATYYLASAASRINISPLGGAMIPGPVFQLTYFGSALKKLGLEVEVFGAGKYKSAFEAFANDTPSEATLEMYRTLEASLRQRMVEDVALSRSKDINEVAGWFRKSMFTSGEAIDLGMVDAVDYQVPFLEGFKAEVKSENKVSLRDYLRSSKDMDEPKTVAGDDKIGLITATGEIRMDSPGQDDGITPTPVVKQLQWMAKQDDVKAVVFRVDSPGGSALASDIIWDEVRKLKNVKPVIVSMGSVAASGGYYIAAPATKIVAEAQTITGSIGVIGMAFVGQEFPEQYGVNFHVVTQSDRKQYFNFGTNASEEAKAIIAASIDEVYQTFISKVAAGRGKTPEQIHELAQGRVYSGHQALELGLVDFIGDEVEAFKIAKETAGLDSSKLYPI